MNITEDEMPTRPQGTEHHQSEDNMGDNHIQLDSSMNISELMKQAGRSGDENLEHNNTQNKPTSDTSHNENGDIVELGDGEAGVFIDLDKLAADRRKKMNSLIGIDKIEQVLSGPTPLYEHMSGEVAPGTVSYGDTIIERNPNSEYAKSLLEVKRAFAGFEPSMTGVSPKGSKEAKKYKEALNALRSKEYRLPTVQEYEQQQKELKERKDKDMEEQRNEPKVINLAQMEEERVHEEELRQPQITQEPEPKSAQGMNPGQVVEFKIPEGQVSNFIDSMEEADKQKVNTSKEIRVVEERMVKVPTATKKITSMDAYKRMVRTDVKSEAVETPLLNSGYLATVKGCGSLEMSSILPDVETMEWTDYAKLYSFCFNNLINTSIGVLSFRDFQIKTSPYDLDGLVHAILRASQPDVNAITLTCGGENCRRDYDIKYSLSSLPDWDSVTDDIKQRIKEIVDAKSLLDDALEVHNNSPVMQEKYVDVGDGKIVVIKTPNGPMIIDRTNEEIMQKISDATSPLTALFLINIKSIFVDVTDDKGKTETYEIVDLGSIATEIQSFSDTQLEILKNELNELKLYDTVKYSFKGVDGKPIVCPHCGRVEKKVPCTVQQLVFQRVSIVMK